MSFDRVFNKVLNESIVKGRSQIELYTEGAKESKALLAKTFPSDTELQQQLLALDQTPSKGDVSAIIKFYNETNDLDILTKYFNLYSKFKAKQIPIKAPTSFKTFIEFTEHVDATDTKQRLKNAPGAPTIEQEDSADKLVDTEELTIYKGDSQHKCVKYGKGYSFCISRQARGNMYDNYRSQKASTFYFIFFKKIPNTNPDHVLVLDRTKNGWEWTNQLNKTKETTLEEVLIKFPVLAQYKNLFVNNPLTETEENKIKFLLDFKRAPSLEKFLATDRELQLLILKSGETIIDEVFTYLTKNNLWDNINEYVSVGPNLTPLQADAIEAKGGAILKQYLKIREIAIPHLEQSMMLKINKFDKNLPYVQQKTEEHYNYAYNKVANGWGYNFSSFIFLDRLPDNIPEIIEEDFYCVGNQLTSLKGAPISVKGNFYCSSNLLTSLKGAPIRVGGNFYCSSNLLTSLKGAPIRVGGNFHCRHNQLTTLEGAPIRVGGNFDCSYNQLTSLKGAPTRVRGRTFLLRGKFKCDFNPGNFTYGDIKAAMKESKRKLEGSTISRESFDSAFYRVLNEGIAEGDQLEQYNEGVREVLAAVIGLGAVGLLYNVNAINRELHKRPESIAQKVDALQQVDQQLDSEEFHRVATDVINRIVQEPSEQPEPQAAQPAQSKEKPTAKPATKEDKKEKEEPPISVKDMGNIYDTIANYILPSEIIGTSIEAKVNDRFMKPYKDDVGKWTIGVGHLIGTGSLKDKKAFDKARAKKGRSSTLSRKEALSLFNQDVSKRIPRVEEKFKELWPTMSTGLKAALVDIEYRGDMESKGEGEFEWVELLRKGKYKEASQKYLDHKEYKKRIKKNPKGDGVVKRMKRNARIIAAEEPADKLASS